MLNDMQFTDAGSGGVVRPNDDDADKRIIRRQLHVLERFRLIRQTIPVHLLSALFRVYLNEGKSVIHYARESGVSQSVMSRHILDLSDTFRSGEPGLGLVTKRQSSTSLREQEVYLTDKGRKVVRETAELLGTGRVDGAGR